MRSRNTSDGLDGSVAHAEMLSCVDVEMLGWALVSQWTVGVGVDARLSSFPPGPPAN